MQVVFGHCTSGNQAELLRLEHKIWNEEEHKKQLIRLADHQERELFTHFVTAVKTSHEKERTYTNNTKYMSKIVSVVLALLVLKSKWDEAKEKELADKRTQETLKKQQKENETESWTDYTKRHMYRLIPYK